VRSLPSDQRRANFRDRAQTFGPEFAFGYRNFLFEGEYQRLHVNQWAGANHLAPTLAFSGGYAEMAYVLIGEPIPYNESRAAFSTPKPDHPFSFQTGGWGAWEVAARSSTVNLNSYVVRGLGQAVTGGVYGGQQTIYTLGLNWFPLRPNFADRAFLAAAFRLTGVAPKPS
jgi:phosphate-selective porin OprO/OprP